MTGQAKQLCMLLAQASEIVVQLTAHFVQPATSLESDYCIHAYVQTEPILLATQ